MQGNKKYTTNTTATGGDIKQQQLILHLVVLLTLQKQDMGEND